jgi:glycosyltransferase involved in cell wall biosynthesis
MRSATADRLREDISIEKKPIIDMTQENSKSERFENYSVEKQKEGVSVLIPCRNEVQNIEECLNHIFNFDPPNGGFEVIVIDGMSTDGTREILMRLKEQYPQMVLIDNPKRTVSYGMNLGIQRAKGEYIVRTDTRCIHPKSYLSDLIELSERTGADNVGGVLVPISGETYVQKSIARAYESRIAMGGALRDRGDFVGETDTVYGGCFKRQRLLEIGMYDEEMVRNQDDELSFRLRERGGKIIQDGRIKVQYWPRRFYWQLFKQFMQYGYWKVMVIKKHPQQASLRHFLPVALVLGFITLGMIALFNAQALTGIGIYSMSYFLAIGLESLRSAYRSSLALWPGMVFAIFLIHISFGIGFIMAIIGRFFPLKLRWFESLSR